MLPLGTLDVVLMLALQGAGAEVHLEASAPQRAQPTAPGRRFTMDLINDGFATIYDEGYTSGVRMMWRDGPPLRALSFDRSSGALGSSVLAEYWTYGLAHDMWTPADLTADKVRLLDDDRPYAGLLAGELQVDLVLDRALTDGGRTRLSGRLMAGVTGDWSFSEPIQRAWHSALRVFTGQDYPKEPQGWDIYEIPETVLVNLRFGVESEVVRETVQSTWGDLTRAPFGTRAAVRADCDLGTFRVGCEGGLVLRMGWMPELTFDGAAPIMEGSEGAAFPVSAHLFASTRIGVMLFDALLDGPIGTDSPTADRRLVRAHIELGGLVQLWSVEIAYAYIIQTNEQTPLPRWVQSFQRMGHIRLSYRL